MRTRNLQSLISRICVKAKQLGIRCNTLTMEYVLQCIVERISIVDDRRVAIKGGFALGHYFGLADRTTRDLDLGFDMESLTEEICIDIMSHAFELDVDDFEFQIIGISPHKSKAKSKGLTVRVRAKYESMVNDLSIDISETVGKTDIVRIEIKNILDDCPVCVLSYSLESEMSEKLHAILYWGTSNTRFKDVYDVWYYQNCSDTDFGSLRKAIVRTFKGFDDCHLIHNAPTIIENMLKSPRMKNGWMVWNSKTEYSRQIEWEEACESVRTVLKESGFR